MSLDPVDGVTMAELARSMERIERKLDKSIEDDRSTLIALEKRVMALEQWRWFVIGAGALGGGSGIWALLGGGG